MRTFSYIIVPALALLNMGVNGATIANALTARHPTQLQGASAFRRGLALDHRQVHNADFSSSTASTPDGAAAPASDPTPAVDPAAAAAAKRDVTGSVPAVGNTVNTVTSGTSLSNLKRTDVGADAPFLSTPATREVHARQDDVGADTDLADVDDADETPAEADPDVEDASEDAAGTAATDTADATAVTRAVHARQDEDDIVDPTADTTDADESSEDAVADAADTAVVTRAVHARQDEDDAVDPAVDTDSADDDEDDAADAAAAEPTETPDNVTTAQDLTTQDPDEESLDARAITPTLIKPLALPRDLIANRRQVGQSLSGDENNIVSDVQIKAPLSDVPGPSLAGRRSITKQVGRRAPQFQGAVAGSGAGAVSLGNSGSN